MPKQYSLTAPDRTVYMSDTPGLLGGNKKLRIYGQLDCKSANRALPKYAKVRVFFADEGGAIEAGFRPCAKCMPGRYKEWKAGGVPGNVSYPWRLAPNQR